MGNGVSFKDNTGPIHIETDHRVARSSVIGKLIEIIATAENSLINLEREPADIEEKIKFNDLDSHYWIFQQYIDNALLLESSITQLNRIIYNGSTKLKRQMKLFYNQALTQFGISRFPNDLEKLKIHSDNIVSKVIVLTKNFVRSSSDLQDGYFDEDIEFGVLLIVSYSIIECIVLESPNDHN